MQLPVHFDAKELGYFYEWTVIYSKRAFGFLAPKTLRHYNLKTWTFFMFKILFEIPILVSLKFKKNAHVVSFHSLITKNNEISS